MVQPYPAICIWEETQSEDNTSTETGFGLCISETAAVYRLRHPEKSVLFGVVAGHLQGRSERS
jgi:hypothetical protein